MTATLNHKTGMNISGWVLEKTLFASNARNPGRFGPIAVRSGRFGRNSGVSRFGPIGAGRFGPISKVGPFGPILGLSRFGLIYLFGENM